MAMAIGKRTYEDFAPPSDLISEKECDTILIYLPGFKKEQLRVQLLTTSRILKLSGERPIGDNKWRRFHKEIRVSPDCDMKEITAKFEGGILYIRQPKLITTVSPAKQQDKEEPVEKPQPPQEQQTLHTSSPKKAEDEKTEKKEDADVKREKEEVVEERRQQEEDKAGEGTQKEEMPASKEEKRKDGKFGSAAERLKQLAGSGRGNLKELKKPENLKRLGVSVLMVFVLGFYIAYMFKSLTRSNEERDVSEFSQEL